MIRSETSRNAPAATVTFTLTHSGLDGQQVAVVGDFNDWDPGATPMQRDNGSHTATMTLEPGRYRFRYLSEDGTWFNDDAADDYAPNDHGGQDCVLDLTPTTEHLTDPRDPDTSEDFPMADLPAAANLETELDLALEHDETTDRELRARDDLGP